MKQLVTVNLTSRTARDWSPPELTFGESLTIALRFYKDSDGEEIETDLDVTSLKASLGAVDARPRGGQFAIKIGPGAATSANTTAPIEWSAQASGIAAAINATTAAAAYGVARVVQCDGSWLLFFGDQTEQVPLTVVNNGLWPISFGRVTAWQVDEKWVHELRLVQAPVAFTNAHDVVLPPAPQITRIQEGGQDAATTWNEIQELYVPPEFRGAFLIKKGFARTTLLSREDDIESIQSALQALYADAWKVSLPLPHKANIEFVGDYAGYAHDLLVVQVEQSPMGDVAFTLELDRAELAAMLRRAQGDPVTLPLEIRIVGTDEGDFTNEMVALSLDVVVRPPVIWPEIEALPLIDWLRPASPKTYVPFGANNVLTGQKYYSVAIGDGENSEFAVATGLEGEHVYVFIRENVSGGRQLINGTDFTVTIDSDNEVTVTALDGPPDEDAWLLTVFSAEQAAQWAADLTVAVPQVVSGSGYPSLPDFMDDIGTRILALEAILPTIGPPPATSTSTPGLVTVIPEIAEVMFYRGADADNLWGKDGLSTGLLSPRAPYMLPAAHDSTPTDPLPTPLPSPALGSVWIADGRTLIPGGSGIRSSYASDNQPVASDGRILYPATRSGTTNSYYPSGYERTLFAMAINDKMLSVNRSLEILWGVQAQLHAHTCNAQWVLSLEIGTFSAESTPATVGLNLEYVNWSSTPVFEQPIVLTRLSQSHFFGVRIKRLAEDFSLDQQLYGVWGGNNDAAPSDANFAIRARLDRFDTENRDDPRGWVGWRLIGSLSVEETSGEMTTNPAMARIY